MDPKNQQNTGSDNMPPMTTPINPKPASDMSSGMQNGNGHKKVGPIISTLVIILILIIAALYLFASRMNNATQPDDTDASASGATSQSVQPVTNTSDDTASLNSDLDASTKGLDGQNF